MTPRAPAPGVAFDLQAIVDDLNAIVWEADPKTYAFTFVSGRAESLLGYALREWTSDPGFWPSHIHPEDRERAVGYCKSEVCAGRDHDFEYRMIASDGRVVWLRDLVRLVRDPAGAPCRLRGLMVDITAQRAAEHALRESQALLRALVEHAPIGIAFGRGGRLLYANPAFADMYGFADPAEVRGIESVQLTAPHEREMLAERIRRRAAGLPEPECYRMMAQRRNGEAFPLRVHATRMRLPDGPATVAFVADVTEQERAEQALRAHEEQLRQAQKMDAIGQLAGGVAHDFNNLLTGILGYSDLMLRELPPGHPQRCRTAEIKRAAERGADIIERLLAFSRQQVMEFRVLDLNRVVADLWDMLGRLITEHIVLETHPGEDLWSVRADPVQIQQVILNLAINARDAMPAGGRLTIATANREVGPDHPAPVPDVAPGAYVELTVRDTGVGMDPETQARIFEPFFTTKGLGGGTGLGLATVYGIVNQSGGVIGVVTVPGEGTAFHVYLPRTLEPPGDAQPAWSGEVEGGKETVLVVEDDQVVRRCVRDMLAERGYHVLEAENGNHALEVVGVHGGPIHLVVTDVIMPGMSGRDLAARLSLQHPGVKVLFISGYDPKLASPGKPDATGAHFLAKPFTADTLARRVRMALEATPA